MNRLVRVLTSLICYVYEACHFVWQKCHWKLVTCCVNENGGVSCSGWWSCCDLLVFTLSAHTCMASQKGHYVLPREVGKKNWNQLRHWLNRCNQTWRIPQGNVWMCVVPRQSTNGNFGCAPWNIRLQTCFGGESSETFSGNNLY